MRLFFVIALLALAPSACGDSFGDGNSGGSTQDGGGAGGKGSGGTAGSGGSGGAQGSNGSGGTAGASGDGGSGGGAGGCSPVCGFGLTCCDGRCVNTANDVNHCGQCQNPCPPDKLYCDGTACTYPPCEGINCIGTKFCCGLLCCGIGELCCNVQGPGPSLGPRCFAPEDGTCPIGCLQCQ